MFLSHMLRFSAFSPKSRSYSVHFSFFTFFIVSCRISRPTVCVSHFPHFSVFSPYSRSYSVHLSFSPFSVFLAIFHVRQCMYLILLVFLFSSQNPGPTMYISFFFTLFSVSRNIPGHTWFVSHFPRFSVLSP